MTSRGAVCAALITLFRERRGLFAAQRASLVAVFREQHDLVEARHSRRAERGVLCAHVAARERLDGREAGALERGACGGLVRRAVRGHVRREQLDELYRTLSTHPMVKVVL
jgi:hypothetical protein